MMFRSVGAALAFFFFSGLAACDAGPQSGWGFTLPEGDVAAGEAAFVRLQCADCHSVSGRDDLRESVAPVTTIVLGGKTERIQTYGQLVTSVINPSHQISRKYKGADAASSTGVKMRNYNDVMTVAEMSDIVTFLQAQYELEPVTPTRYRGYPMR